jgi:hypothetical protein
MHTEAPKGDVGENKMRGQLFSFEISADSIGKSLIFYTNSFYITKVITIINLFCNMIAKS